MKYLIGILLILGGLGLIVWGIVNNYQANWEWDNEVYSSWSLAEKASTIEAKAEHIDKFIEALNKANLSDNDALIYKTPDNDCKNNLGAVTTLRERLDQIKGMDVTSFQYQQAIQQITAQEQGEGGTLTHALYGCWMKANHYYLWNPWYVILFLIAIVLSILFGIVALNWDTY